MSSLPLPPPAAGQPDDTARHVIRLQVITVAWMATECGVALVSASRAHSPALLAFGSDSLVELLSAMVVALHFSPRGGLGEHSANRLSGILLFALAAVVAVTSGLALAGKIAPEPSRPGIAITAAALLVMPLLTRAKRRLARKLGNRALAADAVQSAACAYLAGVTLVGVAINAAFHIGWVDPVTALVAVPLVVVEARRALRGEACDCRPESRGKST
jgi:hypothetical protein